MSKTNAARAVAYLRVSTDKQADKGCSLDAQRAKVEAYAALYDLQLVDVVVDAGVSAKSLDRPGLARALDMLRRGDADALLVVKLDRLTRSVRDLGDLVSGPFAPGKAALLSVGEQIDTRSAAGRLVLNVLASVSQWEREAIGERTSTAMQHMKAEGRFLGGKVAPFGYAVDGDKLVPVEHEQATIARAVELVGEGRSLRAVAAALAGEGRVSRAGRPFVAAQVQRMTQGAAGERRAA